MFDLISLCSQYELLALLGQNLTTIDLYHVALTGSDLYDIILRSTKTFNQLKRNALCDGSGLRNRLATGSDDFGFQQDARLPNAECNETIGYSCLKCGINVCKECRVIPRIGPFGRVIYIPYKEPFVTPDSEFHNIICYCDECDKAIEERVGKDICNCDRYLRWICRACHIQEKRESSWYLRYCTCCTYFVDDEGSEDDNYDDYAEMIKMAYPEPTLLYVRAQRTMSRMASSGMTLRYRHAQRLVRCPPFNNSSC